jgi:hypothetical protein
MQRMLNDPLTMALANAGMWWVCPLVASCQANSIRPHPTPAALGPTPLAVVSLLPPHLHGRPAHAPRNCMRKS